MKTKRSFALSAVLCAALALPTTTNANPAMIEAESIRTLDMMLMATSLRCRKGEHDFRAEYDLFSRHNGHLLRSANDTMRRSLNATYGLRGGERALDRMSVRMANNYGNGHPWMSCSELKAAAVDLARAHSKASLAAAANRLLSPPQIAYDFP